MRNSVIVLALTGLTMSAAFVHGTSRQAPPVEQRSQRSADPQESVKPVYPTQVKEVPSHVARLCDALHGLPRRRRAECCEAKPGAVLTAECVRNLAGALVDGAVLLEEEDVKACEAAMAAAHAGCSWVGPRAPPAPAECRGILRGTRQAGRSCRSNLECVAGLRCNGAGPTDAGVCGSPPPPGGLCGASVDTLAAYARQDDVDLTHPRCAGGFCDRNRCRPFVETGGACTASVQCDAGRCLDGVCTGRRLAAPGERCSAGDCEEGARCIEGVCRSPKPEGEPCIGNGECLAACVGGRCQATCVNPALRRLGSAVVGSR